MNRIHRNAAILLAVMLLAAWIAYGLSMALSVLAGGLLAFLNFRWMTAGVDRPSTRG